MLRGSAKDHQNSCFICLNEVLPQSRVTRNAKRDSWIRCDCCKGWLHACCGGITPTQYSKINKENIWFKCVVCCLQQLNNLSSDSEAKSPVNLVTAAVTKRLSTVKKDNQKILSFSNLCTPGSDCSIKDVEKSPLSVKKSPVINSDSEIKIKSSDQESAGADNILIVDSVNNPVEFSSSRRILKEVNNYFPNVKIDFAYSLSQEGVAIHTTSKNDRDLLIRSLPSESFGGGTRHLPKGRSGSVAYLKGVDTSVSVDYLKEQIQKEGINVLEIRRLCRRFSGKPIQVVRVACTEQSLSRLLNIKLVVNSRLCNIEKQRKVRVIRCYNCQSFGHVAKSCTNERHCELCSHSLSPETLCTANVHCVNCHGNHPSSSSSCTAYIAKYEDLAKQHTKHFHISPSTETSGS